MNKLISKNTRVIRAAIFIVSLVSVTVGLNILFMEDSPEKTEIKTSNIKNISGGSLKGTNITKSEYVLQTDSNLVFESGEITPSIDNANAAIFKWDQTGGEAGAKVELRTKTGGVWSDWIEASDEDDRKDGTTIPHSALVIGGSIDNLQYRFTLNAGENETKQSPQINLENASIEMIDSTQGPSPTKPKNVFQKILKTIGYSNNVSARMDGPRIFSRAEWGSPEPDSSPSWTPEYSTLYRVVIHHTATPNGSDSAATIRAIWYHHAISNGWGDIGYNYLVDTGGNIFQGRYFDPNVAASQKKDVVGGHAYGNNVGTSGIAALGDFTSAPASDRMIDSIANITAFKAANYFFNPSGIGPNGPNVVGHKEVTSTSCPGAGLYARIGDIRVVGDGYYNPRAAMNRLDLTNAGQGYGGIHNVETTVNAGESKQAYFDIRNEGDETWKNDGANPIVLATDQLRDRVSIFSAGGGWQSSNRASTFSEKVVINGDGSKTLTPATTIAPGEIGRFSFTITAPAISSGDYREHFQLVSEGREWFARNLLLSTTVHVMPQIYSWRPVAQHIYTDAQQSASSDTNLVPGERVYIVLKAENTGNQSWYKDDTHPAIRIAPSNARDRTSSFCDASWINCARSTTFQESVVEPGQTGTFGWWIAMPSPSRDFLYYDHYSLVAERVTWMNTEPGIHWPVQVNN